MGVRAVLCLALALGGPAAAQMAEDVVPRPSFLQLMGLMQTAPLEVSSEALGRPVPTPFAVTVPSAQDVVAEIQTGPSGPLATVEFRDSAGRLVESVVFTEATVEAGTPEARAFAMANLLVLRSFAQLAEQRPEAQMLAFSPVEIGDVPAVQLVGTFLSDDGATIFFRHVGFLPEGRENVLVVLCNIAPHLISVRSPRELEDTYSGWMLKALEFLPEAD